MFSYVYKNKLCELFDDDYELSSLYSINKDAVYCILLLYIILVKFNLDFNSFNMGLFGTEDCNELLKKIEILYDRVKKIKNYMINSEQSKRLNNILSIIYTFLEKKIKYDYSEDNDSLNSCLEKQYKEYFKVG